MSGWGRSWNAFLDWLGEQYSKRKSDAEIAIDVSGMSVHWTGKVVRLRLDSKYTPGIEFDMGSHRVELPDGNRIDQHYLYLLVSDPVSWLNTDPGEVVDFAAEIQEANSGSPFSSISLVVDAEQRSVGIRLSIRNGVRLS